MSATKPDLFQLIDLDRTLFDTVRFIDKVIAKVNDTDPAVGEKLRARFEASYHAERTFFVLRYMRERHGDAKVEAWIEEVMQENPTETFLLPGAKERLEVAPQLSHHTPAFGILTYGDEIDQLLKVKIAGLEHVPVYVTQTPNKSVVMDSWKNDDGTFTLPESLGGATVSSLVLEDDKLRAFLNLPAGTKGIWLTNDPEADERLKELEADIHKVRDLFESVDVLKTTYL